jgi:hypothetical protein
VLLHTVRAVLIAIGLLVPAPCFAEPALEVGDYVVYRLSGSYTPTPIELRKEVVAKQGDRVVIDVTLARGDERLRWIAHEPDTLHDLVPADGALALPIPPAASASPETAFLEGWSFSCTRTFGETVWNGVPVKVRSTTCPEFSWGRWEQSMWSGDETIADVSVIETGRGGYTQITCPDGARLVRRKEYDSVEESCTRADGIRVGPWSKRDAHGTPLVRGAYRDGAKHGVWWSNEYGLLEEHCMFDRGREVGYARPWDWTHLRLGAAAGIATGLGDGDGASLVVQAGWDVWSRKRHCRLPTERKRFKTTSIAAVADLHHVVPDDAAPTTLVRLALQGYLVPGEPTDTYLDTNLLETGFFASAGILVHPSPGVSASLGIEYVLGVRLEARYDYLPDRGHLASITLGVTDGVLALRQ